MKDYFKFFSRIAVGLMQRQDFDALIQKLINEAVELAGADFGYIHLLNDKEQCLKIVAASNSVLDEVRNLNLKKGEGIAGYCWQLGETLVVDDYMNWEHRVSNAALSKMKSVIAAPLIRNGSVFGVLGLGSYVTHGFNDTEIDALSHFADVAAVAFDNANLIEQITSELKRNGALTDEVRNSAHRYRALYKQTETRLNQAQALVRISNLINSDASLDQLAARVQESVISTLEYDDVRMFRLYDHFSTSAQVLANEMDSSSTAYSWQAANELISQILEKEHDEATAKAGYVGTLGGLPALIFIVRDAGTPWSAIVATLETPNSEFSKEDRDVLGAISSQLSMAVRQRSLLEKTERQANHDELTSLGNRRLFKQQVNNAMSGNAHEPNEQISLLVFDLDGFKQINDTHGHQVGDLVLCAIAERLQVNSPTGANIARLGGDEFAVLLGDNRMSERDSEVAESLLTAIEQPISISGLNLTVGSSVGISRYPEHGNEYSQLMRAADAAMYSVKSAGKGGFKLFSTKRPQSLENESCKLSDQEGFKPAGRKSSHA
jgi:diguanylate cyclase (GGDEF)-like protein